MLQLRTHRLLPVALLMLGCAADAGRLLPIASAADPLDAAAEVPRVTYRSAFSDYRPLSDDKLDWKQANDTAARIGGWRSYAREAQSPEPAASAGAPAAKPAAPEPSKPMPAGHGSHKMN